MSYELMIDYESVGQIASNGGWRSFREESKRLGAGPALQRFFKNGETKWPSKLSEDIQELLPRLSEPHQAVAFAMLERLRKAGKRSVVSLLM